MKNRTTVERKSDWELVVTRTFNSPAHIVFEAWTKPELFRQCWVPKSMGMSLLSCEMEILGHASLPLALSAPMTLDYRAAYDAMEAVGRRYRVAFASNSLAGLIAIARSGHAISVPTRTAIPPDLHVVTAGLPTLPTIGIALEFADLRPSLAAKALGDHIRAVLPTLRSSAPDLPYAATE